MLGSQIVAPVTGELELLTIFDSLLQDIDTLCIRKTHKSLFQYTFQTFNQRLVNHLVQELQIILTVIKSPTNAVFDEVLFKIHQFFLIKESNLRLYHPELRQVAGSV